MARQIDFSPEEPSVRPTTIQALKSWMEQSGCNFHHYEIDGGRIGEGYILAPVGTWYHWIYTERGVEQVLERFTNEADAVSFAYEEIKADDWACSHLVGFLDNEEDLAVLKSCLKKMGIQYYEDSFLYQGKDDFRYQVFVHGSQANAVTDLRKRFGDPED